jgi:hypothetical protein
MVGKASVAAIPASNCPSGPDAHFQILDTPGISEDSAQTLEQEILVSRFLEVYKGIFFSHLRLRNRALSGMDFRSIQIR